MTSPLPRIAIPEPTSTDQPYNQRSLPQYLHALEAAGAIPVPIPLAASAAEQAGLLATCSGVLLPGSPADLDPARYGQEKAKESAEKDGPREAADDLLLDQAFAQGKPVLGICYGLQSLNVWCKGSLIQHLPALHADPASVVNHEPGRTVLEAHLVAVSPGSRLSTLIPESEVLVNSSHHQAIDQPGQGLRVAAVSPKDGVIEALEGSTPGRFLLAVQWHPERSYEQSPASRALFASFLEAARAWNAR
jgi:putative glutamine amidotransferase